MKFSLLLAFCLPLTGFAQTQKFDSPKTIPPNETQLKEIQKLQNSLKASLAKLEKNSNLPDVEIYLKASEWILRHNEFWHADSVKWTIAALEMGRERAELLEAGKTAWLQPSTKSTLRAYRSSIDGSVQPYSVSYPADYEKAKSKPYRLDVVLHGRDPSLTEVKFLNSHNGTRESAKDRNYVQIEIFGRGNNAYRWAGEDDVLSVIDHFLASEKRENRESLLDPKRIVLRGFSMGGAGTWHLGLHHPDRFCVIGPGAGFTTTHGYIKNLPNPLPSPQEECLTIYDAVRYAENAREVPIVAYSGAKDPQKAAADRIEERLKQLKIYRMTHLVAPGLEHQFPAEWQKKGDEEWTRFADVGRPRDPKEVHFTTYTLKYPRCEWITLTGLEKHYQLAQIDAVHDNEGYRIETKNVTAFQIKSSETKPARFRIDGQKVVTELAARTSYQLVKQNNQWKVIAENLKSIQKIPGLQGPIDDAFTSRFVQFVGSGSPISKQNQLHLDRSREQFERNWDLFFRGKVRTSTGSELDESEIFSSNLLLWGDPQSNPMIAKVLPKLPLKWTAEKIEFGVETYDAKNHFVAMIYPNPLNPKKYLVLNSGHTFGEADFKGTNALLYPRLGDYAVFKVTPGEKDVPTVEVVRSGLFNEKWEIDPTQKER